MPEPVPHHSALDDLLVELAGRLKIARPLCCFDLETTGTSTERDRIVELAAAFVDPDGAVYSNSVLLNPGIPIPGSATAVHGIGDAHVRDKPRFKQIAKDLLSRVSACDFIGFNVRRFDLPILAAEFARASLTFDYSSAKIVDAFELFQRREPRDLSAAVRFYTGGTHDGAHRGAADVKATLAVLRGQMDRYSDLPTGVDGLADYCLNRSPEDLTDDGRIAWRDGAARLTFGKHVGRSLDEMADSNDRGYLEWMLQGNFPPDTKRVVAEALNGSFPSKPAIVG